jgi:hypothetical protein
VASMAWLGCSGAGGFLLTRKSARTLPVTLRSVRDVTPAGATATPGQGQQPHEVIRREADDDADEVAI